MYVMQVLGVVLGEDMHYLKEVRARVKVCKKIVLKKFATLAILKKEIWFSLKFKGGRSTEGAQRSSTGLPIGVMTNQFFFKTYDIFPVIFQDLIEVPECLVHQTYVYISKVSVSVFGSFY